MKGIKTSRLIQAKNLTSEISQMSKYPKTNEMSAFSSALGPSGTSTGLRNLAGLSSTSSQKASAGTEKIDGNKIGELIGVSSGASKKVTGKLGEDLEEENETNFEMGAHIRTRVADNLSIYHHGIYIGRGLVIDFIEQGVRVAILEAFAGDQEIEVVKCEDKERFPPDLICHIAFSYLIKENDFGAYNCLGNNCEHFANMCETGKHKSDQVGSIFSFLQAGVSIVTNILKKK